MFRRGHKLPFQKQLTHVRTGTIRNNFLLGSRYTEKSLCEGEDRVKGGEVDWGGTRANSRKAMLRL
jgi:hypothetical protein